MDSFTLQSYKAADGMEMLRRVNAFFPGADKWSKEAEDPDRSFSMFNGELIGCGGVTHKTSWTGIAWLIPDTDIDKLRKIDPRVVKDKLSDIIENFKYRRVEASVREDFPAAHSYMRYLGFKVEGLMIASEMDGSNGFLYARIEVI